MNKTVKRVRVNWYKLLYSLKDEKLIRYFWRWFNTHKVKSLQRAARFVLIRYYSTTSMPEVVKKHFTLNSDIKKVSYNFYG